MIILHTTLGNIKITLTPETTPITVANFLRYAKEGLYDGTIFHRVIPRFVVQGGGYNEAFTLKPTYEPIVNEADKGLSNLKGTVAMARTNDPHSATNQFFINVADNTFLDFQKKATDGWGYCVFGKVTEGMEIVEALSQVSRSRQGMHDDVPNIPVILEKVEIVELTTA